MDRNLKNSEIESTALNTLQKFEHKERKKSANTSVANIYKIANQHETCKVKNEKRDATDFEDYNKNSETFLKQEQEIISDYKDSNEVEFNQNKSIAETFQVELNEDILKIPERNEMTNKKREFYHQKIYAIENNCAVCNKVFSQQRDLIKHVQQNHPNAKAFKCRDCPTVFSKLKSLSSHCNRLHFDPSNKIFCEECNKSFTHSSLLERHKRTQCKNRSFYGDKNISGALQTDIPKITELNDKTYKKAENRQYKIYAIENECAVCNKMFTYQRDLVKHALQVHPNAKAFKCQDCPTVFSKLKSLSSHCNRLHLESSKKYTCEDCNKYFITSFLLERHRKIHSKDRPFYCTLCDRSYKYKRNLWVHQKTHENDNQNDFTGQQCYYDEIILTDEEVQGNLYTTSNSYDEPIFLCTECGRTYENIDNLKAHQKTHRNFESECEVIIDNQAVNDDINNTYFIIDEFNTDSEIEEENILDYSRNEFGYDNSSVNTKILECTYCKYHFYSLESLSLHATTHKDLLKRHVCEYCLKSFYRMSDLKRHKRIHTDERPYSCTMCDKTFKQLDHLKRHKEATHNIMREPLTFSCEFCSKSFPRIYALKRHLSIHSGECPYPCSMCKLSFKTRSDWETHEENHNLRKYFVCKYCSKSFGSSKSLNRHFNVHVGERRYICTLCDKAFKEKSHLKNHQKIHMKS